MLKKSLMLLVICIALSFSAKQSVNAQLKYGAGIFHGTWLNNPGLNFRAEFDIAEGLVAVPKIDLSIWKVKGIGFLENLILTIHQLKDILSSIGRNTHRHGGIIILVIIMQLGKSLRKVYKEIMHLTVEQEVFCS